MISPTSTQYGRLVRFWIWSTCNGGLKERLCPEGTSTVMSLVSCRHRALSGQMTGALVLAAFAAGAVSAAWAGAARAHRVIEAPTIARARTAFIGFITNLLGRHVAW